MTQKRAGKALMAAAVVVGLLASLGLLAPRLAEENRDRHILTAISYSDLLRYAEAAGTDEAEALGRFASAGVDALVLNGGELGALPDSPEQLARRMGLQVIPSGAAAEEIPADAPLYIPDLFEADGGMTDAVLARLSEAGIPVAVIENEAQNGHNLPEAFRNYEGGMVKGFYLWPDKAARYAVLGYGGAEEIENTLFRAAAERGASFLWLAPFLADGEIVTDMTEYAALIEGLTERLQPYRFDRGGVSPTEPFEANPILLALAAWGVAAAGIALAGRFWDLKGYGVLLLAAALAGSAGLAYAAPRLLQQGAALAAAILAPCWSVWVFAAAVRGVAGRWEIGALRLLGSAAAALAVSFAAALLGGLFTAGLISDSDFMLGLAVFRGVKLSQTLPLAFAGGLIFWTIYHEKDRGLRGDVAAIASGFRKHALLKCLVLAVLLAAAIAIFVLRTGNVKFSVPDGEQRLRNWLETVLYARPRSKEFLVAYPAFLAMFWVAARRFQNLILPFSVLAAIGFASAVNTFCHGRAPFVLSVIRADTGVLLGALLGIALFFCAETVYRAVMRRKNGPQTGEEKALRPENAG